MNNNPLDAITEFGKILDAEGIKSRFTLMSFGVFPAVGHEGPAVIQATFVVNPRDVGKSEEQFKIDEEFENILKASAEAETEQKIADTIETMKQRLEEGKNFLGE